MSLQVTIHSNPTAGTEAVIRKLQELAGQHTRIDRVFSEFCRWRNSEKYKPHVYVARKYNNSITLHHGQIQLLAEVTEKEE